MVKSKAFTLIEAILSITIFAMIIVSAFEILWNIWIIKTKISNRLDINQDLYYMVENLATQIKDFWWDIDYEEYWNRSAVWTTTSSWHYNIFSWYWNYWYDWNESSNSYWSWFYFCRSWSGSDMWTSGCLTENSWVLYNDVQVDQSWAFQRYWEYAFQFYDYNSNKNSDITSGTAYCVASDGSTHAAIIWDENCDWSIRADDDDENLGQWPQALPWNEVKELYMIKKWKTTERMFFRWTFKPDPDSPTYNVTTHTDHNCTLTWANAWSGCLWNVQMLKLVWKDIWMDHSWSVASPWRYDWIIDTWLCNTDFNCNWTNSLPNSLDDWWIDLFPEYINVKDIRFFLYPNKDYKLAWKEESQNVALNPYVRIQMTLWYSWKRKKQIRLDNPYLTITTTINLTKN